ncbi:hypothetical protein HN587_02355 [Candidatus Woesearchaeota archaeon]|jgi:hypothetical protein|nr:hypothetical protein [Candidatus Woesearchaeota archaeon]
MSTALRLKNKKNIVLVFDFDYTLSEETQQTPIFRKYWDNICAKYSQPDFVKIVKAKFPDFNFDFHKEKYFRFKDCETFGEGVGWLQRLIWDWNEGVFGDLTIDKLKESGKDIKLSPGLPDFFPRFKENWAKKGVNISFYIVSVGLKELVQGSKIGKYMDGIFASNIAINTFPGSDKTKYGISSVMTPYSKTEASYIIRKGSRKKRDKPMIPKDYFVYNYKQIICVGDGMSDIPFFSHYKKRGAKAVAVYEAGSKDSFQNAVDRVGFITNCVVPRDFSKGKTTEKLFHKLVQEILDNDCVLDAYDLHQYARGEITDQKKMDYVAEHIKNCPICSDKTKLITFPPK